MTGWIEMDIDAVPEGTMIYDAGRSPLGIIRNYLAMNGNGSPHPERHLDNGKRGDRFAYRRAGIYRRAKASGKVFVREQRGKTEGTER